MKYFSMFTGVGGFELGIQQAYENIFSKEEKKRAREEDEETIRSKENAAYDEGNKGLGHGGTKPQQHPNEPRDRQPVCIGFSEIDKCASQLLSVKWPTIRNYGDANTINPDELPDFDLLVGGFPCQSFSIAGKRAGFSDTRGTLFFEIARIIKQKQPRLLLLENVKGLLSHDQGRTFSTIISALDELGYDLQWQVLNSKNFGVPQNRERVFIVGHLRGTPRPQVFPIGAGSEQHNDQANEQGIANTLTGRSASGHNRRGNYIRQVNNPVHSNDRVYDKEGLSPTLNTMQGGRRQPKVADTLQYKGLYDKLGIYASSQKTNSVKILRELQEEIGEKAFTKWGFGVLDSFQKEEVLRPILHGSSVRLSTSKEEPKVDDGTLSRSEDLSERALRDLWEARCNGRSPQESGLARQFTIKLATALSELSQQTTPLQIRRLTPLETERLQGFPDNWTKDFSDTQRYKMMGNAVTVNVIEYIARKLL